MSKAKSNPSAATLEGTDSNIVKDDVGIDSTAVAADQSHTNEFVATNNQVCWHNSPGSSGKFRDRCRLDHYGDLSFTYGRCQSGRRWFWLVNYYYNTPKGFVGEPDVYGWEETEQAALDIARATIVQLANGNSASARFFPGYASRKLKEINTAKRAARPPSDSTNSKPTEYLFSYYTHTSDYDCSTSRHFIRFQIVKKTAKRIYYLDTAEEVDELSGEPVREDYGGIRSLDYARNGFVDRQKLETDGEVRNRGRHWSSDDYHLYASLQIVRERFSPRDAEEDIAALKAAMADAHPDRDGSSEQFIAARQRYVDARRRARSAVT